MPPDYMSIHDTLAV